MTSDSPLDRLGSLARVNRWRFVLREMGWAGTFAELLRRGGQTAKAYWEIFPGA